MDFTSTNIVSFNDSTYDIGGCEEDDTQDYFGPDVRRLAAFICKSDENFPLKFVRDESDDESTVGFFYPVDEDDDEYRVAVMYVGTVETPKHVA